MKLSISLPDEIIKEILSPVLHVPDEAFASTSSRSPFSHYEPTTSTVLLVCKAWLRVATPLLYNTVVLRSKAQAHALARSLKENTQLGRFVLKFRLEGGFGNAIYDILKRTPAITDICITGALWSYESIGGYVKGLKLVNPRRLVYFGDLTDYSPNKNQVDLGKALAESIRDKWTLLVVFETDSSLRHSPIVKALQTRALMGFTLNSEKLSDSHVFIMMELAKLPSLGIIRVIGEDYLNKPRFEDLVAKNLTVTDPFSRIIKGQLYDFLVQNRSIYDKVVFSQPGSRLREKQLQETAPFQPLPLDARYQPLHGVARDVRATVWTRILRFAAALNDINEVNGIPHSVYKHQSHGLSERLCMQAFRANLALVSKEFNAFATPLLYEAPTINKRSTFESLARSERKSLIKIIYFELHPGPDPDDAISVNELVEGCSALASICASGMIYSRGSSPLVTLITLSPSIRTRGLSILYSALNAASFSLQHLHLPLGLAGNEADAIVLREISALGQLHQLKSLILAIRVLASKRMRAERTPRLDKDCLPHLQCLGIDGDVDSPLAQKLLDCLTNVRLPLLQRFDVHGSNFTSSCETFLRAHGHKLLVLTAVLGIRGLFSTACSNVSTWIIDDEGGQFRRGHAGMYDFTCLDPVVESAELALNTIVITGPCYEPKALDGLWQNDLLAKSPRLERVRVASIRWPPNQHEIEKSGWVPLAEVLWERFRVKLVDWDGKWWAPRLKVWESKKGVKNVVK
ncbi:hypothetical protein BKA70DRAFT_171408 [Coprinopsis sp. MPI-PUGE-AT-0042]|nr:hypothetical protein BKA70DRAFT_171408 [Coprinopsis sp. MPI-PUGE-AT-0042]